VFLYFTRAFVSIQDSGTTSLEITSINYSCMDSLGFLVVWQYAGVRTTQTDCKKNQTNSKKRKNYLYTKTYN